MRIHSNRNALPRTKQMEKHVLARSGQLGQHLKSTLFLLSQCTFGLQLCRLSETLAERNKSHAGLRALRTAMAEHMNLASTVEQTATYITKTNVVGKHFTCLLVSGISPLFPPSNVNQECQTFSDCLFACFLRFGRVSLSDIFAALVSGRGSCCIISRPLANEATKAPKRTDT